MISPKLLRKNILEHFFPPPVDKREILLFNVAQKLTKECFNDRAVYWNTLTYLTSLFRKSPLELMLLSHCEIFNSILKSPQFWKPSSEVKGLQGCQMTGTALQSWVPGAEFSALFTWHSFAAVIASMTKLPQGDRTRASTQQNIKVHTVGALWHSSPHVRWFVQIHHLDS